MINIPHPVIRRKSPARSRENRGAQRRARNELLADNNRAASAGPRRARARVRDAARCERKM